MPTVCLEAARDIISEARPASIDAAALQHLNGFCSELLLLSLSAAASPPGATAISASASRATLNLPITTEQWKALGFLRVLPSSLGRDAILEAELAVREMGRTGGRTWRSEHAKQHNAAAQNDQIDVRTVHAELSAWIDVVGSLARPQQDGSIFADIDAVRQQVQATVGSTALHTSPMLAIYVATALSEVAESVLRSVELGAHQTSASASDIYNALRKDEALWDSFAGFLEAEIAASNRRSQSSPASPRGSESSIDRSAPVSYDKPARSRFGSLRGRSTTATGISNRPVTPSRDSATMPKVDETSTRDFEALMSSGRTKQISLTPGRLQTMGAYDRAPSSSFASKVGTLTAGEDAFSKPKRSHDLSASSTAPAAAAHSSMPPPSSNPRSPMRKLQARSAVKTPDEDSDDEMAGSRGRKESLKDFFNSAPPWEQSLPPSSGGDKLAKLGMASARSAPNLRKAQHLHEMDIDDYLNEVDAPPVPPSRRRPGVVRLQAKSAQGPREQSSRDLMDFLSGPPPPMPRTQTPSIAESRTSTGSRKAGKFRGMLRLINSPSSSDMQAMLEAPLPLPPAPQASARSSQPHSPFPDDDLPLRAPFAAASPRPMPAPAAVRRNGLEPGFEPSKITSVPLAVRQNSNASSTYHSVQGMPTPAHSAARPDSATLEDVSTLAPLKDQVRRISLQGPIGPPTPPSSPERVRTVKRVPVPSRENSLDGTKRSSIATLQTFKQRSDASTQTDHPTILDVSSASLVDLLSTLRSGMLGAASAEQCVALLDAAINNADDDATHFADMEARAVEWLLGGLPADPSAVPVTPGLTSDHQTASEGSDVESDGSLEAMADASDATDAAVQKVDRYVKPVSPVLSTFAEARTSVFHPEPAVSRVAAHLIEA